MNDYPIERHVVDMLETVQDLNAAGMHATFSLHPCANAGSLIVVQVWENTDDFEFDLHRDDWDVTRKIFSFSEFTEGGYSHKFGDAALRLSQLLPKKEIDL